MLLHGSDKLFLVVGLGRASLTAAIGSRGSGEVLLGTRSGVLSASSRGRSSTVDAAFAQSASMNSNRHSCLDMQRSGIAGEEAVLRRQGSDNGIGGPYA